MVETIAGIVATEWFAALMSVVIFVIYSHIRSRQHNIEQQQRIDEIEAGEEAREEQIKNNILEHVAEQYQRQQGIIEQLQQDVTVHMEKRAEAEGQLGERLNRIDTLEAQLMDMAKTIGVLEERISSLKGRVDKAEGKASEYKFERDKLLTENNALRDQLNALKRAENSLLQENTSAKQRVVELQKRTQELERQLTDE